MTNDQRTDSARATSRDHDVRAHERAQYATPPTVPTHLPTGGTTPGLSNARTNGSADAREEPPAQAILDDETGPWLVGYRIDRIANNALLLGFKPPITEMMKRKRWAVLVAGEGWAIPLRYLAHVERLLTGADVTLFDTEGAPTPAQRERERAEDRTANQRVFDELHAAREAAEANPAAVAAARAEARRAFAEAVAASPVIAQPEPADSDAAS